MCGEHPPLLPKMTDCFGSSPRVWGAPDSHLQNAVGHRLIPTCVGSTHRLSDAHGQASAHPHVCGEHFLVMLPAKPTHGSSPRVWGALFAFAAPAGGLRLIPTCVGSTITGQRSLAGGAAHPHVCGEHKFSLKFQGFQPGSSPRVWGALVVGKPDGHPERLIPTCVGSTTNIFAHLGLRAAHPHVCGEHGLAVDHLARPCGSSPRVWGALPCGSHCIHGLRLIPTCVGSTCTV